MITPPDELYSPVEAGTLLGRSERQVQRYLETGVLAGVKLGGGWRIPALAIWRKLGIEAEMVALWRDYCRDEARCRREEAQAEAQPQTKPDVEPAPAKLRGDAETGDDTPASSKRVVNKYRHLD